MILQALNALSQRENLIPDADFEFKPMAWVVRLTDDGGLAGIESHRTNVNAGAKRKPKFVGNPMLVPRMPGRTSGDYAFFFFDKAEYVFGIDPTGKRSKEKLAIRNELFRERVADVANLADDDSLQAVLQFLESLPEYHAILSERCEADGWAANDLFAFRVGLDEQPVHLRSAIRSIWKEMRAAEQLRPDRNAVRCLVSGELLSEPGLVPLIKKVPGGSTGGISLVSFNSKAFESFGLSGNENAPVSREAAERAATALNRLLDHDFPDPADPSRHMPPRSVRFGSDTAVCFWAVSESQDVESVVDALEEELTGREEQSESDVGKSYRSVWRGEQHPLEESGAFYVLILSGQQGRAIVRDWIETTLADAQRNLAAHFEDLSIVRSARARKGGSLPPTIPLRWLLDSLAAPGKNETVPASLGAGLLRAAFTDTPYPFQILQRALLRERAEVGNDDWTDAARRDARASLMRAVLNRRRRPTQYDPHPSAADRYPEVPMSLNPSLTNPGYTLGALMAVLERLQQAALGDVNASVVDRYFGAASAAPRAVFVRLLKNARHHARKAGDAEQPPDRALAFKLEKLIDHFCGQFEIDTKRYPYSATGLPARLDLEQQGLFVIGYHQMRHWLWLPKDERSKWEAEHPEAPSGFRRKMRPAFADGDSQPDSTDN